MHVNCTKLFNILLVQDELSRITPIDEDEDSNAHSLLVYNEEQDENEVFYRVERVIREKKDKNGVVTQQYVKWEGWGSKYNQWVPVTEVIDVEPAESAKTTRMNATIN